MKFAAIVGVAAAANLEELKLTKNGVTIPLKSNDLDFIKYTADFGKSYGTAEEFKFRAAQFKKTADYVRKHNSDPNETHELELNEFADMT